MPNFSVIIPTHDRPEALARCLAALAEQSHPGDDFEVIVVDDGSPEAVRLQPPTSDPTSDPTSGPTVRLVRQTQAGPAAARNHGARLASGRYLVFTDDDCIPTRSWLESLARRFDDTPEAVIGGQTQNALPHRLCSEASQLIVSYIYRCSNSDPERARFFTSNNFALAARAFASVNGFDESFQRASAEDRDLCARLVASGYRLIHAPEVVLGHAHDLGPWGFWRQHFTYGRGAFSFRGVGKSDERRPFESLRFYLGLVAYPLREAPLPRSLVLAGLAAGSQVATICGYLRERLRIRPREAARVTG